MIWKIVLVLGVTIGVHGDEDAVSEQRVVIHHPKHAAIISHAEDKQENHKDYAWSYPSYEFSYKVKDPHTHDIKGQNEERDGDKVKGDYWLIEPTGRKRTVKYHADDEMGFNAHVDYTKSEYLLKEQDQNNQVEDRGLNSQDDEQLKTQNKGNSYEVTENNDKDDQMNIAINNGENENNDERVQIENLGEQKGNIQEEDRIKNQEGNGGNDVIEPTENNNNENQEPISDAIVISEALNENIESQDRCKCNERGQNDYRTNNNEVKTTNSGGQEMTSRRKRKNINRSINFKSGDNSENLKPVELGEVAKNNDRKSSQSGGKKNSHNNNVNDRKKKNENVNFGSRNGKRKQIQTSDHYKYEEKSQNNTAKIEEKKDRIKSENIDQNDNDYKYHHRILIHHPKAGVPTPRKS